MSQLRSPLFRRRFVAAGGVYVSALLGFAGSIVAVRELGIYAFGLLSLVLAATGFFQLLADLTVEEALVKYGFRYAAREEWGRFHRVFRIGLWLKLAGGAIGTAGIAVLAPLSGMIWTHGLFGPMLLAALIPVVQSPEGVASAALIVRGRYDVRAGFLSVSMALRLAALAIGGLYGVTATVAALVAAQALSTVAILGAGAVVLGRFPRSEPVPLGEDRIPFRRFVVRSSIGSVLSPLRGFLGTLLLGIVTGPRQVAYFQVGEVPQSAFAALTAPVRLILLTEQTEDIERGREDRAYRMLRRYSVGAGVFMLVVLPPLAVLMPTLIRFAYGDAAAPATNAARLFLAVAAIQVVLGWSKSFPVSIGRPEFRLLAQGAEIAVLVPLLIILGSKYGATGGAGAFVIAACVFAAVWTGIVYRLRRERRAARATVAPR
jgi:O-antigen/teichoic acid export membrane protein